MFKRDCVNGQPWGLMAISSTCSSLLQAGYRVQLVERLAGSLMLGLHAFSLRLFASLMEIQKSAVRSRGDILATLVVRAGQIAGIS